MLSQLTKRKEHIMNTWPGPDNSWEGVDAYFTWAD